MLSLKRSTVEAHAVNAQPTKKTKKGTAVVLNYDAWRHIASFVDSESISPLACTSTTLRDAAVVRDVAIGQFSLAPLTEHHLLEFAKKDGFNAYFQDLFAGHASTHSKWEPWFAELGDIGTKKGNVPTGVTVGVLHLLRYGSRSQLQALVRLCNRDEGFDDPPLLLEARKR